jgi:hypothetical protein
LDGRSAAIISLKTVIVIAEPAPREQLQPPPRMALVERCAGLLPGPVTTVAAATENADGDRPQVATAQHRSHEHEKTLTRLTPNSPDVVAAPAGLRHGMEVLRVASPRSTNVVHHAGPRQHGDIMKQT